MLFRTPVDQEIESGSNVRILCQVRGGSDDRTTEIYWSKDGVRIVPSSEEDSLYAVQAFICSFVRLSSCSVCMSLADWATATGGLLGITICLLLRNGRVALCVFPKDTASEFPEITGCSFPAERHEEKLRMLLKKFSGMTRHGIELRFTNWKADAFAPLQAICRPNKATVTLRYFACGKNAQQRFPQRSCSTCC